MHSPQPGHSGRLALPTDRATWRRVLVVAGMALAVVLLAAAAVYAVGFLMLAPMMQ